MGTMGYMSPEQVRGLPGRSPLGHLLVRGDPVRAALRARRRSSATRRATRSRRSCKEEPPELTQSGRNVSPALDHIVRHCLEKDRDNRFQSAKDVAFALSEASSTTTTVDERGARPAATAEPEEGWDRARRWPSFSRPRGLFLWKRQKSSAPSAAGVKRVAVLPFENLGSPEDDYFADGIADAIRGKLTSLPGLEVIARGSSTPYKKTTKTPQEIARELGAQYLLTATVRWQKGGGGNRVQVSPELVEIRESGAPASKWQQPFDAAITDVFQVQSDIATKVAQALGVALGAGEEKRLSEKPTQNLAAYEAFLKGEEAANGLAASDPPSLRKALAFYEQAVALDPGFAQAWARVSHANSLLYANSIPTPALAERARQAAEKAVALAPNRPEGYLALGSYERLVTVNHNHALEQCEKGLRTAPGDASLLSATALAEQSLGRWDAAVEHFRQAERLDPRSVDTLRRLGEALDRLRRYPEAREALDRGLALAPANVTLIEDKAMTFLGEGDLAGSRAVLEAASRDVEPTTLVAYLAFYWDLGWVLDEEQRELLLRLTPNAFDDDRGGWALCFTQAYALKGDGANVRNYAEEARKAFDEQVRVAPRDPPRRVALGLALAYLGRKEEAIREGERAVALAPVSQDAIIGPYCQHQLARIYMLVGEPEKALDQLEPLLKMPYYLSPAWLKIDPNFDPLRQNPRFQKLVAAK